MIFFLFILGTDITNPEDLNQYVVLGQDSLKKYSCGICYKFFHRSRHNVLCHLESKHFQGYFSYTCDLCGKVAGSNNAMQKHKSLHHNSSKNTLE